MAQQVDPRHVIRGYQGKLYNDGDFMAAVPEFTITLTFNSTDYQGAGRKLVAGVDTGYSQALTFTETHVTDELIAKLLEYVQSRMPEPFEFVGFIERADGDHAEIVCRNCEPAGDVNLAQIQRGQISERDWNWRINEEIDPQRLLGPTP